MFSKSKDPSAEEPRAGEQRATYEIEDFAALDGDQVAELLARAEADLANQLPSCAHLVVTCDLRTGLVTHHIPCSSGKEALALAAQVLADQNVEREFTIKVTPLLPH